VEGDHSSPQEDEEEEEDEEEGVLLGSSISMTVGYLTSLSTSRGESGISFGEYSIISRHRGALNDDDADDDDVDDGQEDLGILLSPLPPPLFNATVSCQQMSFGRHSKHSRVDDGKIHTRKGKIYAPSREIPSKKR